MRGTQFIVQIIYRIQRLQESQWQGVDRVSRTLQIGKLVVLYA